MLPIVLTLKHKFSSLSHFAKESVAIPTRVRLFRSKLRLIYGGLFCEHDGSLRRKSALLLIAKMVRASIDVGATEMDCFVFDGNALCLTHL